MSIHTEEEILAVLEGRRNPNSCLTDSGELAASAGSAVLRLTLKRKWFDMIASGEKRAEYREINDWIVSRLKGKTYDVVEFSNGYGANVPKVTVKYIGWRTGVGRPEWGGVPGKPVIIIDLGPVISKPNA